MKLNSEIKNDCLLTCETSENNNNKLKNEQLGCVLISLSFLLIGISSFFVKFTQLVLPGIFQPLSFVFVQAFGDLALAYGLAKFRKEEIVQLNKLQYKRWFFLRTSGSFFTVVFFMLSLFYLRSSSTQIIRSLNPLLILILCHFILKEQFYMRYIFGIFISLFGSSLIVLNERKPTISSSSELVEYSFDKEALYGLFYGLISVLISSITGLSYKVLANYKVSLNTQLFYVAVSTLFYTMVYELMTNEFKVNISYVFMCLINAVIVYLAQYFYYEGITKVDLSQATALAYLRMLSVFILGYLFLGEKIYFSDLIGTIIILIYPVYNIYNPIAAENRNNNH